MKGRGAILSFFCIVHMKVKKTCSCFTLGDIRVASFLLLPFPSLSSSTFNSKTWKTYPKQKKNRKGKLERNLPMALDSTHYDTLGEIKLIPKSSSPEDTWCCPWVLATQSSDTLIAQLQWEGVLAEQ